MYVVEFEDFEGKDFGPTFFNIRVSDISSPGNSWMIARQYSEFVALRDSLRDLYPCKVLPQLPSSSILAYISGDAFKLKRAAGLLEFLQVVLSDIEPEPKSACLRSFLKVYRPCPASDSLRNSLGLMSENNNGLLTEDVLVDALRYLDASEVVKLSRVSRGWYFASLSPIIWKRIKLVSSRYETIQKGFMALLDRLTSEAPACLDSLVVHSQFSSRGRMNLRTSLPDVSVFHNLQSLDLSSLYIPSDSRCSIEGLFGEILESILSNPESVSLSTVRITADLSSDIIRSLVGISSLRPFRNIELIFLRADWTPEINARILQLLGNCSSTLESVVIRVSYNDANIGSVPDSYMGERTSNYAENEAFLQLLPTLMNVRKFHYDFFPKNFTNHDIEHQLRFPPNLQDLDIRFIVPGIGDGRDLTITDRRSLLIDVLEGVPKCIRKIRLRTIGVDELEMMNHTEFIPYMFSPPETTFDIYLPRALSEWENKFSKLETLQLEGPQLVNPGFWRYLVNTPAVLGQFFQVFSQLESFTLVNSIQELTEDFVVSCILKLPRLRELVLGGTNEKLTDDFLMLIADRGRDSQLHARIWHSGFRRLIVPVTRYMSSIGIGAIEYQLSQNKRVQVALEPSLTITGRDKLVSHQDQGGNKFIFTRF